MVEINTQIGMMVKLFNTELFGGYQYIEKDRRHLFVVKQRNAGEETNGMKITDFIDTFADAIQSLTGDKPDTDPEGKLALTWPTGVKDYVEAFEVYVNEVFLKIEKIVKKEDGAEAKKDPEVEGEDVEYAFWIGIRMTEDAKKNIQELPLFKIIQLQELYIKIWKLDAGRTDIIERMQLGDLEKYVRLPAPK